MSQYSTLLFDADETLLDFPFAENSAIKSVCDKFGIKYNQDIFHTYSNINLALWKQFEKGIVTRDVIKIRRFEQFAEVVGTSASPKEMADYYVTSLSLFGKTLDGAEDLCRKLSSKYDMYIVTNGLAPVQKSRLNKCGLLPFFKGVFISEETGSQKPEKAFFDFVFDRITEKDTSKICIIGDSMTSDILGGINAGIDTCFYNPLNKPIIYSPTYTAKNYGDISKIFG